jgi:hypothetical protein
MLLCVPGADVLYLFGKVSASSTGSGGGGGGKGSGGNSWQSCCVVVPNLHRSLLVVPRPEVFDDSDGQIAALEAAVAADPARKIELLQVCNEGLGLGLGLFVVAMKHASDVPTTKCNWLTWLLLLMMCVVCCCCLRCVCLQLLHARCTELKAELRALMLRHGIKSMRLVPVKRNYAFEDTSIPAREQWVIKVGACLCMKAITGGGVGRGGGCDQGRLREQCPQCPVSGAAVLWYVQRLRNPAPSLLACRCATQRHCPPCPWVCLAPTLWPLLAPTRAHWRRCC